MPRDTWEAKEQAKLESDIALAWQGIGQQEEALKAFCVAVEQAALAGRSSLFHVLETCAPLLVSLEDGKVLWQIYHAIQEVDAWWKTEE